MQIKNLPFIELYSSLGFTTEICILYKEKKNGSSFYKEDLQSRMY